MYCKNLKIRTKKYVKYLYCKLENKEVTIQSCNECDKKSYIKKEKIKGKKHKQTIETEIDKFVKASVWYRDKRRCIFCGAVVPMFFANAHLIPRSSGGLGIEENIFTACPECHIKQDNGLQSKEYTLRAENYLKGIYGAKWDKNKLIYSKWGNKNGYL